MSAQPCAWDRPLQAHGQVGNRGLWPSPCAGRGLCVPHRGQGSIPAAAVVTPPPQLMRTLQGEHMHGPPVRPPHWKLPGMCPGGKAPGAGVGVVTVCELAGGSGHQVPHLPRHSVPERCSPQGHPPGLQERVVQGRLESLSGVTSGEQSLPGTRSLAPAPGCAGTDPQTQSPQPRGRCHRRPRQGHADSHPEGRATAGSAAAAGRERAGTHRRGDSSTPDPVWPGPRGGLTWSMRGCLSPSVGYSSLAAFSAPQSPPLNNPPTLSPPVFGGSAAAPPHLITVTPV